jgi:hypothetical protein
MSDAPDILQKNPSPAPEPEKQEKKRRAGAFWWWGAGLLAIAALLGGGYYYTSLMKKHAARDRIENAYFFRIDGKDSQGRPASFDFVILTNDFTWVKGSTSEVSAQGASIPEAEAAERVFSPKIRESLSKASDLIAVGLASQEGEREREEERAVARSQTIAGWLTKVSPSAATLWTMTLGQYNKGCKQQEDTDTSFERPIILSGVRSKASGANLQEALADAISGHDNLPSRECYSRFDMTKVR